MSLRTQEIVLNTAEASMQNSSDGSKNLYKEQMVSRLFPWEHFKENQK